MGNIMITYVVGNDQYRIREYLREHAPNAIIGEDGLKMQGLFDQAPVILYYPPADLKISEDIVVFIVSEKKSKKAKNSIEFNILKGAEIARWIKEEVARQGFAINPDALAFLASRYRDTWQTKLDLDTICSYVHEKKTISVDDVYAVVTDVSEEKIFDLT